MNILIVDDEPLVTESLEYLLEDEFVVTSYNHPEEALTMLRDGHVFHVILSDFKMPVMNGIEFLEEAKVLLPSCHRIILTGYSDVTEINLALSSGVIEHVIKKPFSIDALRTIINKFS